MTGLELRFMLTDSMAAEFEQRAAIGLAQASGRFRAFWFDTPAGDLMRAATALHVRQADTGWIQSVELAADGPFQRQSVERAVDAPRPQREALPDRDDPLGRLPHAWFALLVPVFEAEVERQVRLVGPEPGLRVELACERGELRAGNRSERIAEVVLRHREGPEAAFYHFAAQWAALHGARLVLESIHLRGLELAGWRPPTPPPARAEPVAPAAAVPVAEAAGEVIARQLQHLVANILPVRGSTDPEGPRQLRLALRRLRATIRFFGLDAHGPSAAAGDPAPAGWRELRRAARELAAAAAPVRDADVVEDGVLADLARALEGDAALHALGQALARSREHDRARLRAALASPETTGFILRAHAALGTLAARSWEQPDFGAYATGRVERLAARLRRRTRRARTAADWGKVRRAVRDLRHALEVCRRVAATREPAGAAIDLLRRWQRWLGKPEELAAARRTVARALAHLDAPVEVGVRAAALVDGFHAFPAATNRPGRLRKPILGGLERLLAPAVVP